MDSPTVVQPRRVDIRPWGRSGQADEMNASELTGTIVPVFEPGKNRSWASVSPSAPVAMTTYNIRKGQHFQENNRCERGHNLNTISLLSIASTQMG